jgi:hypothetical protein
MPMLIALAAKPGARALFVTAMILTVPFWTIGSWVATPAT